MRFMLMQTGCVLGWLVTFGACAFVIQDKGGHMMSVLQGWAMDEPMYFEVDIDQDDLDGDG